MQCSVYLKATPEGNQCKGNSADAHITPLGVIPVAAFSFPERGVYCAHVWRFGWTEWTRWTNTDGHGVGAKWSGKMTGEGADPTPEGTYGRGGKD